MNLWPLAIVAAALPVCPAAAQTVSGSAGVVDGDTLDVNGRKVRLFGIDAPEARQTCDRDGEAWACGEESANQLRTLIGESRADCSGSEVDQYGRLVAVCWAGSLELNKTMVAYGWATAFRKYSSAYVADEVRAKGAKRGLWASSFDLPEAYRLARAQTAASATAARNRPARQAAAPIVPGCVIKGNRSRRGAWIYHLPDMPYYEQTRAEEMFCSEADAQAAGYRRSRADQ